MSILQIFDDIADDCGHKFASGLLTFAWAGAKATTTKYDDAAVLELQQLLVKRGFLNEPVIDVDGDEADFDTGDDSDGGLSTSDPSTVPPPPPPEPSGDTTIASVTPPDQPAGDGGSAGAPSGEGAQQ